MYILGISAMSHDSAAALLGDSGIIAAIEEGKLARTRTMGGVPRTAIQFCLDRAGIKWNDLAHVAVASQPAPRSAGTSGEPTDVGTLKQLAGTFADRVKTFDHHMCHAASAFYGSPFESALILSLDEKGDGRSGLVAVGDSTRIREIDSIPSSQSLAWLYSQFTQLLGFRHHGDEHKTQWLSLAGQPVFADAFVAMIRQGRAAAPNVDAKYFRRDHIAELCFTDEFYGQIASSAPEKRPGAPVFDDAKRANIAASIQKAVSTVLCESLSDLRLKTGQTNLCLAGGLFLNPLIVAAIEANSGFQNVFVQAAAGNEGTALGAAWLMRHESTDQPRDIAVGVPFWGPAYSNEQIKQVLDNCKATYRWLDSEDLKLGETVRLLQAGKIVAFFQGAAEFGPRALGNRSLLASPWAPYVKENLNDFVKHRESFRPFALAIPEENCSEFFHASPNARCLTTMATANESGRKLLQGLPEGFLLHDNLVRLQVVRERDNPLFWKLLKRSADNAPAPILVNTSFNLFGEPLVVTPRDAIRSYFCSGTDALIAGNFLLEKR